MDTLSQLERKEQELLALNSTLDQERIVAIADEILSDKTNQDQSSSNNQELKSTTTPRTNTTTPRMNNNTPRTKTATPRSKTKPTNVKLSSTPVGSARTPRGRRLVAESSPATDDIDDMFVPSEVGLEGKVRLQRARIKVLTDDSTAQLQKIKVLENKLGTVQQTNQKLKEENTRLLKHSKTTDVALEKSNRALNAEKESVSKLKDRVREAEQDLREMTLSARKSGNQADAGRDVRLNRALEEVEVQRMRVQELESAAKEKDAAHDKQKKKWVAEIQRQEKQKAELFAAFRKQMKLIDILKRQKMHIEAAKQLSFTEDEFMGILESAGQ